MAQEHTHMVVWKTRIGDVHRVEGTEISCRVLTKSLESFAKDQERRRKAGETFMIKDWVVSVELLEIVKTQNTLRQTNFSVDTK